jgi:hypothetical protein
MLKKTINFTDFNGTERSETHYFHLSKSELMRKEMSVEGGFAEKLQRISEKMDAPAIMEVFEDLISLSYGEKSDDGRRFIKSKELSEAFMQTGAYDALYMELITDADAAAAFFKAVIPEDLAKEVDKSNHPALKK